MSINIKNICNQEQKLSFNFYLKIYNDHVLEILKDIEPERIEMIAISTNKDIFEVGSMFRPYNNFKSLMTFYNELSSILKLIELFKLNEKIR